MINLKYDLHIHSCLSPCGDDDMTPANIVGMAAIKELDVIAVTDHNSCKNCPVIMKMGKEYGITVIPGMELTTQEEVHVLCLFSELEKAMDFDKLVYDRLVPVANNEEIFGKQQIYNENDEISGVVENLLINCTDISFDEVYDLTAAYNGIMIPAHIDKSANSLISNLGFVPLESRFNCFEIKNMSRLHSLQDKNPYLKKCKVITDSDAHYLEHINEPVNSIYARSSALKDVLKALS